ncbi:MAG: 1-acyl-sn-glycerol-3-phosphate acyltransferase [Planctomycetes bacterium]|nr:1-acyl-sn-glycerol-3-phosphate acyltransferase [Planctomycetota bacterium]
MIVFWAFWSVGVWTLSFLWMTVAILVSLPFLPFMRFERLQPLLPGRMLAMIPRWTLSSIRVEHHPGFDPNRVSVILPNHTSMMDAHLLLRAIPTGFCGVMNAAHVWIPVYGWLMRLGNAIPLPKNREGRTAEITAAAKERASRGISIIVFPEAHRTLDGKLREFRRGGFFMARDAGLPVVPMAIRGMYEVFPKGTWIMRPGDVTIHVGPQVETAGLTDEQVGELAARVRAWISAIVERGERPADETLRVGVGATEALPATGGTETSGN